MRFTRSMAAKRRGEIPDVTPPNSSSPRASSPEPTTSRRTQKPKAPPAEITLEQCELFVKNPSINPITGKGISLAGPKYKELLDKCKQYFADNYEEDIVINLLSEKDTFAYSSCRSIVNTYTPSRMIPHPYDDNDVPIDSAFGKRMLETCANVHKLVMLHIKYGTSNMAVIPVKVNKVGDVLYISNIETVHQVITNLIQQWGQGGNENLVLINGMIRGLQRIIDVDILHTETKEELQDLLFELVAIKEGLEIVRSRSSVSSSSSVKSKNRSTSLDIPSGQPVFAKKTRKEILEELERACIEMRDVISYDDFEDMKKKQLRLVVAIGPKNKEGQQRCYYVKNIYNLVKEEIKAKRLPKDPVSKAVVTSYEIENVIMPKMRYLNPNLKTPGDVKRGKYPNLVLKIREVRAPSTLHYYEVGLERIIGKKVAWSRLFGYIPAYVETEAADINSATVIAKIRELFDNGRLLNANMQPRVHINKSVTYWEEGDVVRKLNHMMNELNYF